VELEVSEAAVLAIAQKAIKLNTGARGLRAIIEGIMLDIMYKIPSDPNILKVTVTGETIEGGKPEIVKKNEMSA
jgi:ATP-dependent Clp protease ATP-binding subunit ClpX